MKKRFLSLLMVFCMLITCMPTVGADKTTEEEEEGATSSYSFCELCEDEETQYEKISHIKFQELEEETEENSAVVYVCDARGTPVAVSKDALSWSGTEDSGTITWSCDPESKAISIVCIDMPEANGKGFLTAIVGEGEDAKECELTIRFIVDSPEADEDEDNEDEEQTKIGFYSLDGEKFEEVGGIRFRKGNDAKTVYLRAGKDADEALDEDVFEYIDLTWEAGGDSIVDLTVGEDGAVTIPALTDFFEGTLIAALNGETAKLDISYISSINHQGALTFWLDEDDVNKEGEGYILAYSKHDERLTLNIPEIEETGRARSSSPTTAGQQNDRFCIVTVVNDPGMPKSDADVYEAVIENISFEVAEAAPSGSKKNADWDEKIELKLGRDIVEICTEPFSELEDVQWRITAEIDFSEPVYIVNEDDEIEAINQCELEMLFARHFYSNIDIDLRSEEDDAYQLALEYIAALCADASTEDFIDEYMTLDRYETDDMTDEDKAELKENIKDDFEDISAVVIQLPGGEFTGDLEIIGSGLPHSVELRGAKSNGALVTKINGSVRALVNGEQQIELYDLYFIGKGKDQATYEVDEVEYGNYGITGPGEVCHEGCIFEDFWAAIYANYPEPEYAKLRRRYDNVGSVEECFLNNHIGVYFAGATCTANGGADVIVSDALFKGNDCAVYFESLYPSDEKIPYYMYGVECSRFLGNGVDIVYADSPLIFCPQNFYGDADGVRRAPRVLAGWNVVLAADVEEAQQANVSVAPMYADVSMHKDSLIVDMSEVSSFKMENDKAEDLTFELKTAADANLAIEMVEMDKDDNSAAMVGTWNIAAKSAETE